MNSLTWPSALGAAVLASAALLSVGCKDEYGSPPPGELPTASITLDDLSTPSKVDSADVFLTGRAECPGCPVTDWQPYCPAIDCPSGDNFDITWSNENTGASGIATHAIVPTCQCPPFIGGLCYSACRHVWQARVPLALGDNAIGISIAAPGYQDGTAWTTLQRAPLPPEWTSVQPGAGEVTLAWTAVEGATSYNLYWCTLAYGYAHLCTQVADVVSPYTHTGLEAGTTYYYYVLAEAAGVESFDSVRAEAVPY